jgi:hypothetical protein
VDDLELQGISIHVNITRRLAGMAMTLQDVSIKLLDALGGNETMFSCVASRIILRSGVNLKGPRPDQISDPQCVAKVLDAISQMGYTLK